MSKQHSLTLPESLSCSLSSGLNLNRLLCFESEAVCRPEVEEKVQRCRVHSPPANPLTKMKTTPEAHGKRCLRTKHLLVEGCLICCEGRSHPASGYVSLNFITAPSLIPLFHQSSFNDGSRLVLNFNLTSAPERNLFFGCPSRRMRCFLSS